MPCNPLQEIKNKFPVINEIIAKTQKKKNRDMIVLAVVIAVCMFLVFLYK